MIVGICRPKPSPRRGIIVRWASTPAWLRISTSLNPDLGSAGMRDKAVERSCARTSVVAVPVRLRRFVNDCSRRGGAGGGTSAAAPVYEGCGRSP